MTDDAVQQPAAAGPADGAAADAVGAESPVGAKPGNGGSPPDGKPQPDVDAEPGEQPAAGAEADPDDQDDGVPRHAWDSRRELYQHSPTIILGASARLGGSLVGGDQHGVSGGEVTGDVILGGTKVEYHLGQGEPEGASGEIPAAEVEALSKRFAYPEPQAEGVWTDTAADPFGAALEQLREHRVAVLSGSAATGRRSAALMLLRTVGATSYRALDPALAPGRLPGVLDSACGYLLDGFDSRTERALREPHVRAAAERLRANGGFLVIVTGRHLGIPDGVPHTLWRAPLAISLLRAHLGREDLAGHPVEDLLALDQVQEVVEHDRPVQELARFAQCVGAYARGELPLSALADFGHYSAERQVREWFDDSEAGLHEKAFLLSLAAFDESPFPLIAEFGDVLHQLLQRVEDPEEPARIPVFGASSAKRIAFAGAQQYQETEVTDWGPVPQTKLRFSSPFTAIALLREAWLGQPSSRTALLAWLRRLANDPRPIVHTRAASTAAVLLAADLPSAMALLVRPWAGAVRYRSRLVAANALALAHHLGALHVPRILRSWITDSDHRLRWTAVRTYASVGDTFAAEALDALTEAARAVGARGGPSRAFADEPDELAQAAASLLLAQAEEPAGEEHRRAAHLWDRLVPLLRSHSTREFVLHTVIHAGGPTDEAEGAGRPLLIDLFARADATPGTDGALLRQAQAALWHAALNDPGSTSSALAVVRGWVRRADDDGEAETALAELLSAVAVTSEDRKRLAYLLENVRAESGEQERPAVAARLHAVILG
ncbi:hypothetical protein ABUW04_30790 [Streptacidiphilus sp. N1-10]|uniref:Uncharacterized protein n=1 Tax=Streptacidiphilus jeojiensis TaxID=3229225 RepID=A0ABV6XX40_9ACTN